jgi:hypothetical protein
VRRSVADHPTATDQRETSACAMMIAAAFGKVSRNEARDV